MFNSASMSIEGDDEMRNLWAHTFVQAPGLPLILGVSYHDDVM